MNGCRDGRRRSGANGLHRALRNWLARVAAAGKTGAPAAQPYAIHDLRTAGSGPLDARAAHSGEPCLVEVDLRDCRWFGASGLAYSPDGPHPYVRTLVEFDAGQLAYEGSYIEAYWRTWTPPHQAAYLGLEPLHAHPLLLETPPLHAALPWADANVADLLARRRWSERADYRRLLESGCPPARSCGPKPDWFGRERFARLVELRTAIASGGYHAVNPAAVTPGSEPIVGSCLLRGGEVRVLVLDGQHRAAALAALGRPRTAVALHVPRRGVPEWTDRDAVRDWPLVRAGLFREGDALAVFDRVFDALPPPEVRALAAHRPAAPAR